MNTCIIKERRKKLSINDGKIIVESEKKNRNYILYWQKQMTEVIDFKASLRASLSTNTDKNFINEFSLPFKYTRVSGIFVNFN